MINLLNIGQVLVELLSSETINIKLFHAACEGVRILCETDNTEYMQHVSRISSNRHILDHMFEILGTGEVESGYKTSIGRLLFVLMNDDIFCKDMNNETQDHNQSDTTLSRSGTLLVLDKDRIRIMLGIGLDSEDNELSSIMLRCVYKLTKGYACIGDKQIDTIIKYFRYNQKNQTNSKTEILLEILNISLSRPAVANFFIKNSCLQVVDEWMKDQSDPELLIAYGNLLLNACQYTPLSQIINELKTFQWMNKHNLCQDEPLWNHIISRLLSINLSLKFAFNNTLDVMNITSEGFYVFKHLKHVNLFDFPSLGKILRENDKNKIVYVFTRDQNVSFRDKHIEKYIADISILLRDSNHISLKTSMPMSEHSLLLSNPEESEQFDVEMKLNMKQDLEIIATYVRNQMIGHEDHDQIDQDLLDEHLEEIITEHNSNVIPIGHVKIGLQFERSLLFKILCDVFGYPCTLVRDEYQNMSYNQVCIDLDDNDNLMQDNARQVFYYHVDLMSNPPQLIPLQGLSE
uniref:Armadillo repeat-containing protein 3 n=1 Tax=Cacopsylla melanoneura TaxID=428564 RepID=A0A8D8R1J6_9HEMI